jgi:hypothetical protein
LVVGRLVLSGRNIKIRPHLLAVHDDYDAQRFFPVELKSGSLPIGGRNHALIVPGDEPFLDQGLSELD